MTRELVAGVLSAPIIGTSGDNKHQMKKGIVVIGRNEGKRLIACLQSLVSDHRPVVYVDSGSSDGSPGEAKRLGADVFVLDMSAPFTAARARNAGLMRLNENWRDLNYVQFIDGDCVVAGGWFDTAEAFLDKHHDVAVVCGRRREARPNATVYNRLCDIEWDAPVGEVTECGGDILVRIPAMRDVKGYCSSLVAGEEPELCVRLRERGWKIWRLPNEMTLHDANILHFSQWWKRSLRGGLAFAAVFMMCAQSEKRIWASQLYSAIFWGIGLPLAILTASIWHTSALGLLVAYPLQIIRIAINRGATNALSWQYALFTLISKFAEAVGIVKYFISRIMRHKIGLVEYK